MANIENISVPSVGATNYQITLERSLNAVDAHSHELDGGLPIKKVHVDAVDDVTVGVNGSNQLYVKPSSLTEAKFGSGVACPAGTIIAYVGTTAPTGWLLCNGSAVSRTTYSGLFAIIGEAWGEGDNSTTFNIPDMRGLFMRGRMNASSNNADVDAASRTALVAGGATGDNVGSYQASSVSAHTHASGYQTVTPGGGSTSGATEEGRALFGTGHSTSNTNIHATPTANNAGQSTESRPNNIAVNYIVKT